MTEPEGIPDLVCPEGYAPGWLNSEGLPTSCVNNMPMPEPEPITEAQPEVVVEAAPPVQEAETVVEVGVSPTPPVLADTGIAGDTFTGLIVGVSLVIVGLTVRYGTRRV